MTDAVAGRYPAFHMTVYLVRHAVAGDRGRWLGNDRLRPLARDGRHQAADLVDALAQLVAVSRRTSQSESRGDEQRKKQ